MAFQKGVCANPGGRPKSDNIFLDAVKAAAKGALADIIDISKNGKEDNRLKASIWLAERGYGKAAQSVEVSGKDGGPLIAVIRDG